MSCQRNVRPLAEERPYPKETAWLYGLGNIYQKEPEEDFLNCILNMLDEGYRSAEHKLE